MAPTGREPGGAGSALGGRRTRRGLVHEVDRRGRHADDRSHDDGAPHDTADPAADTMSDHLHPHWPPRSEPTLPREWRRPTRTGDEAPGRPDHDRAGGSHTPIRPIVFVPEFVNQIPPSGPAAMPSGREIVGLE